MPQCPQGTQPYTIKSGDSLWKIAQHFHTTVQAITSVNPMLDEYNLFIGQVICVPQSYEHAPMPPQTPSECISVSELALHDHMRLLWEQHVYWTRLAFISTIFGLPDQQYTVNRLLRNPKDFEAVLKMYYGEDTAKTFSDLLTAHLKIASDLVNAVKSGNNAAAADSEKQWYANAGQIAGFLASINPYWTMQDWTRMLDSHLAMTKAEANSILKQNYEDSINIFDQIEQEALMMADMMTQGLMKQFSQ